MDQYNEHVTTAAAIRRTMLRQGVETATLYTSPILVTGRMHELTRSRVTGVTVRAWSELSRPNGAKVLAFEAPALIFVDGFKVSRARYASVRALRLIAYTRENKVKIFALEGRTGRDKRAVELA